MTLIVIPVPNVQNKALAEDLNIDLKNNNNCHKDQGTDIEKEVCFTDDFKDDKSVSLKVQSTYESYDQWDHETNWWS